MRRTAPCVVSSASPSANRWAKCSAGRPVIRKLMIGLHVFAWSHAARSGYAGPPDSCKSAQADGVFLQRVAQPQAGAQKFLRIDRLAVDPRLVVQVRSGRASGGSEPADDLAGAYLLADLHVDRGKMREAVGQPVAVIDFDHPAVAAVPARVSDGAGRGGADRLAFLAAEIDAGVHGGGVHERVEPNPESRGHVDLAEHWLAN